jgi:hypothetical protein
MQLCSDKHEEVCYEGRICPVCVLKEEIAGWEKEGSKLQLRIDQLEEEKELAEMAAAEAAESSQTVG